MVKQSSNSSEMMRFRFVRIVLLIVGLVFASRLFYIQVVKHDYYRNRADKSHLKKLELEAERGEIYVYDEGEVVPLVLNQTLKKVIADPRFIEDKEGTAKKISDITHADKSKYMDALTRDTAYAVLEEAIPLDQAAEIETLELKGVALRDSIIRVYPEGELASHVLGFVNKEGQGQYGVEQHLNDTLKGQSGFLSGAFDVRGIPIATSENVDVEPVDGKDLVLTIDRNLQKQAEKVLKDGLTKYKAKSGSVVVMDPNTGAIKAMANYPTFNPGTYSSVDDISVFVNSVISAPYEVGSVVKPLTMALGLKQGVVTPDSTFADTGFKRIDDFTIRNAGAFVAKTRTMTEVITRSVNTGVVHVLENLGGNKTELDNPDKHMLYDFFTKSLRLGEITNVELAGEQPGVLFSPSESSRVRYANMTFGQGMTTNMVQVLAAMSAVINGGTYYKPTVIDGLRQDNGEVTRNRPTILEDGLVTSTVANQVKEMMETVVEEAGGYTAYKPGYRIGGKTGSAQIPNPEGGYLEDSEIGSFIGFAPSEEPKFIAMVRIDEPQSPITAFAGSGAAAPVFAELSDWLINYYGIAPSKENRN